MSRSAAVKRQVSTRVSAFDARILVRQHRALGAAGGAGGVEDRGEIVGSARDRLEIQRHGFHFLGESPVPRDAEALGRRQAELSCKLARRRQHVGAAEGQRRLGVAEEIFEFGERIGRVQRQERGPRPQASERQHDRVGRLVDLRCHPVARPDAERDQRIGRSRRALDESAEGQGEGVACLQGQPLRLAGGAGGDEVEQVGGGWHGFPQVDVGVVERGGRRGFSLGRGCAR